MRRRRVLAFSATLSVAALATGTASADNILLWTGGMGHGGITNVKNVLMAAGNTVTESATVPADLTPFDSLWAMDFFNGPDTVEEKAMVTTFLNSDRGVFAQFEWDCCKNSQNNWTAVLAPLLKDDFLIQGSQGVSQNAIANATEPFGLTTTPNALPNLQVNATANIVTIPDANVVYRLNGTPVVGAYVDPQFVSGDGCVVLSGDIEQVIAAPQANQWIQNVQYFLQNCMPNPPEVPGDGFLAAGEECDDGNVANGDGCSSQSTIEAGFDCVNDTSQTPVSNCGPAVIPCAGQGTACTVGVGACQASGIIECPGGGAPQCSVVAGQPSAETCDAIDNDCDGVVDEGFDLGALCSLGVGDCASQGVMVCAPDGTAECDAAVGQPSAETCDASDNDCDGSSDEGFDLGASCSVGVGACMASGQLVCNASGGTSCSAAPGAPVAEACDGLDNDCDGQADEGFQLGSACTVGVGACQAPGIVVCDGSGAAKCDAQPGQPSAEVCDAIDNDCDGAVDEGFNLGTACNVGVGACMTAGLRICAADGTATCSAQPAQPGVETCDWIDDDCDGQVDEGFQLGEACTAGVGACEAPGVFACAQDGSAQCTAQPGSPVAEICDGIDNDCDGQVDEGLGLEKPCTVGVGACEAAGVVICGDGGATTCSAQAAQPHDETCDGIDNDCDGLVDDGLGLNSDCSVGVGACEVKGRVVCLPNGAAACDAQAGQPSAELCDQLDNDCDGEADEDFDLGRSCVMGMGACQAPGSVVCAPDGAAMCSAVAGSPVAEACDGIDNDCDGQVDDGNPGGGAACNTKLHGLCAVGAMHCDAADVTCAVTTAPGTVPESCTDAVDSDCDGLLSNGCAGDADGDGLSDADEEAFGTDPSDADSDDDGIPDGEEPDPSADYDGDGLVNAMDPDSDNDGLFDGTEEGRQCDGPGTFVLAGHCIADTDFGDTTTSAVDADSDDDGVLDGSEDPSRDGRVDASEGDGADSDGDGLGDALEAALGLDPSDTDSDEDGVMDRAEPNFADDTDGDGLINALDADSDNDELFDGTEMGFACEHPGTDPAAGHCKADADLGASKTSPVDPDSDKGGVKDGFEDANHDGAKDPLETDPNFGHDDDDDDKDKDGVPDAIELAMGTDPLDADADDDGVIDGDEIDGDLDTDEDGLINVLDPDSDGDGLFDGTEMGLGCDLPATSVAAAHCFADADMGLSKTSPILADSDGSGFADGAEDANKNGKVDGVETDPNDAADDGDQDKDDDGLSDSAELAIGADPFDADSDDDGVPDGSELEPAKDADGDGFANAVDADSDNDGLFDGTEMGFDCSAPATDAAAKQCVADADAGATKSDPLDWDSDGDGLADGTEDKNRNGKFDAGELDPLNPLDNPGLGPECSQDKPCGIGFTCDLTTGVCQPIAFECGSDGDCPAGEVCDAASRQCVAEAECSGDDDCDEGFLCDLTAGQCVASSETSGTGGSGGSDYSMESPTAGCQCSIESSSSSAPTPATWGALAALAAAFARLRRRPARSAK